MIIFFNLLGLGMLILSGAIGLGVRYLLGASGEAAFMLTAGPIALLLDVPYRLLSPSGHWLSPTGGGNFLFIPIWFYATCWCIFGTLYAVLGHEELGIWG